LSPFDCRGVVQERDNGGDSARIRRGRMPSAVFVSYPFDTVSLKGGSHDIERGLHIVVLDGFV
jgi:hypothetical protein